MNKPPCKANVPDVVSPRVPMLLALSALALGIFVLVKVFELEQRILRNAEE